MVRQLWKHTSNLMFLQQSHSLAVLDFYLAKHKQQRQKNTEWWGQIQSIRHPAYETKIAVHEINGSSRLKQRNKGSSRHKLPLWLGNIACFNKYPCIWIQSVIVSNSWILSVTRLQSASPELFIYDDFAQIDPALIANLDMLRSSPCLDRSL